MEFLAAPLLWGITAAGVPLILHFIGRAKPVPHVFPAMRFILRSQRTSSRALKLKHVLILLLRIAALVLIAMALARPFTGAAAVTAMWVGSGLIMALLAGLAFYHREFTAGLCGLLVLAGLVMTYPSDDKLASTKIQGDFVLVLDHSASMGYLESQGTRLDLARKQALEFLDRLAPESRVAFLVATETVDRVQARLSFRHNFVKDSLRNLAPSGRGFDLGAALQAAEEVLARDGRKDSSKQAIILFTDLQENAISKILATKPAAKKNESSPPLIVVDVGSENAPNGAALSVRLPSTTLPAESKAEVIGTVRPLDKEHSCIVELYIDGQRVAQKTVDPRGEEVVNVALDFMTGSAGSHTGKLHIPDSDRLPVDQDFHFAYTCGRPASALIVERPASGGRKGTGFFLSAALQYGADNSLSSAGLTCVVQNSQSVTREELARHRVVILADCGPLPSASWEALQQWTSDGGGLFVWLGPNTDASFANLGYQPLAPYEGLLPGKIGLLSKFAQPQPIQISQPDHPVLARLSAGASAILSEVKATQTVRITPQPQDQNSTVILSLNDGTPVLLEKVYGRGRVLCAAIDPGLECSSLPRHGEAFVTLTLDSARLLSGEDSELKARLGMPLILNIPTMPPDGQVLWHKPGATVPVILRVDATGKSEIKGAPVTNFAAPVTAIVPPLDSPGIHQFNWYPAGALTPLSKHVAVNTDSAETKLNKASMNVCLKALGNWNPEIVHNIFDAQMLASGGGAGAGSREVSVALVMMLLGLLLSESFLANRLYRGESEIEPAAESTLEKVKSEQPAELVAEARPSDGG